MEFEERTIRVIIDQAKCEGCKTYACVSACKLYSREVLTLKDGKLTLGGDSEFIKRVGTECLSCEYQCRVKGNGAIRILAPTPGLDDYRLQRGLSL